MVRVIGNCQISLDAGEKGNNNKSMIDSSVLERYSLFDGLEQEQINRILPLMEQEVYNAGDDIITEGSQNYRIYFILEGRVAAVKGDIVLEEMYEGSFFGEMEVLDVNPSAATVRAMTSAKLMVFSIDAFGELYEADLKTFSFIVLNLARDLSRKVRRLNVMVTKESPPTDWS